MGSCRLHTDSLHLFKGVVKAYAPLGVRLRDALLAARDEATRGQRVAVELGGVLLDLALGADLRRHARHLGQGNLSRGVTAMVDTAIIVSSILPCIPSISLSGAQYGRRYLEHIAFLDIEFHTETKAVTELDTWVTTPGQAAVMILKTCAVRRSSPCC